MHARALPEIQLPDLPIAEALPSLIEALRLRGRAVLQAPPGAGKTTVVPLALLQSGIVTGRILMLEPRRLAARAAAERMAHSLGESAGETVDTVCAARRKSTQTRIECHRRDFTDDPSTEL